MVRTSSMRLSYKLVVSTSTIEILVFKSWFFCDSHTHSITIIHLLSCISHSFGPEKICQLSSQHFSMIEEWWSFTITQQENKINYKAAVADLEIFEDAVVNEGFP